MTDRQDESALIAAAADGDAQAFDALYVRHVAAVVSLATARLRDPVRAHDVTQDVFLRLYMSLSEFRQDAALRTWLVRVTLNCCTDLERRQRRHWIHEVAEVSSTSAAVAGSQEDDAARHSESKLLRRAIADLPQDLRVLVSLRYDANLSYADIAATVDLPMGTVATRLARALRQLRAALQTLR